MTKQQLQIHNDDFNRIDGVIAGIDRHAAGSVCSIFTSFTAVNGVAEGENEAP
jgi:hypothetical protein